MPCQIWLLPVPKSSASFHDFEQYERLVNSARELNRQTELIVLLGGDASLRCGEMIALEWSDIDLSVHPADAAVNVCPSRASAHPGSTGAE
jgi:hypothetical protein